MIGGTGLVLGIGIFFAALAMKEQISGWLSLLFPAALLIAFASAGYIVAGTKGSVMYSVRFAVFLGTAILLASILSKTGLISSKAVMIITLLLSNLAGSIASKLVERLFHIMNPYHRDGR